MLWAQGSHPSHRPAVAGLHRGDNRRAWLSSSANQQALQERPCHRHRDALHLPCGPHHPALRAVRGSRACSVVPPATAGAVTAFEQTRLRTASTTWHLAAGALFAATLELLPAVLEHAPVLTLLAFTFGITVMFTLVHRPLRPPRPPCRSSPPLPTPPR